MHRDGSLPRLRRQSLGAEAYDAIRKAILSGRLRPGQRVIEQHLARQLGVSRAPVREALHRLANEGLVETLPHRGTYVVDLSPKDMWEVYTMRAALETLAIRLVGSTLEPETAEELGSIVAAMETAAKDGRLDDLSEMDMRFHRVICEAAGHRRLLESWTEMYAHIRMFISLTGAQKMVSDGERIRYHRDVLDAMCRGEAEEAAALQREHILTVGERIVAALKAADGLAQPVNAARE